jgi:hypothetical protein
MSEGIDIAKLLEALGLEVHKNGDPRRLVAARLSRGFHERGRLTRGQLLGVDCMGCFRPAGHQGQFGGKFLC